MPCYCPDTIPKTSCLNSVGSSPVNGVTFTAPCRRHESTSTLGLYFYEPTSLSSERRSEGGSPHHWLLPRCLQILLKPTPFPIRASSHQFIYLQLRFQPRGFVKELLKLPHPGGPLGHSSRQCLLKAPLTSPAHTELLQLLHLDCRAKHPLILQLWDMLPSVSWLDWTALEVRNWSAVYFPSVQYQAGPTKGGSWSR